MHELAVCKLLVNCDELTVSGCVDNSIQKDLVCYTVPCLGSVGVLQCGGESDGNDIHRSGHPNRGKKMFS